MFVRSSLSFASMLVAGVALYGCSADKSPAKPGPSNLEDGAVVEDTGVASEDTDFIPEDTEPVGFDVNQDVAPEVGLDPDAGCATATAAAVKQAVDIIMVIDQSGSMDAEIAQVQTNINKLSTYLAATGLDYRLVMIAGVPASGDYNPVCVPTPLAGPSCTSKPPRYRAVDEHVESWDALKLIIQTYDSTATATKWSDFLRPDAIKVFIPVTDDDATDSFLAVPRANSFDDMILSRGKGTFGTKSKRKYVFFPITGVSTTSTTIKCSTAVNVGQVYVDLATLTKGKPFSVCELNYEPVFKAIGKAIATSVACEVAIPPPPAGQEFDPNKVNVTLTGGTGSELVPQDPSLDCFGGANGWQYSADMTKILLCGDACASAKSDPSARIDVEFGCATRVKPPS
jgi:hypothetical protein